MLDKYFTVSFSNSFVKLLWIVTRDVKIGFFLKFDYRLLKINFFLDYRFWRHSDHWLLEHAGLPWGLMQLSRWVVERQAYKQTGHADWTDRLSPVTGTFSQPQRVGEEGRQQRVVNSIVWNDILISSRWRWGERGEPASHQQTICNHTDLPVGLLGKPVGGQATAHNAGGRPWSVNWGEGFHLNYQQG